MTDQHALVWVPDPVKVFVQGDLIATKIVKDKAKIDKQVGVVRLRDTHEELEFPIIDVSPVNPSTFDKVDDMSELTHLNEPSVLYNLENRYRDDMIYTYSGLFLVAINPYCNVKIYTQEYIDLYHGSPKEDNKPHIFAVAEAAYQKLLSDKQDQSILVTGESGAGKTENTKKILQYLASITSEDKLLSSKHESFELKILQSNPILESFGNSQTVRNNNSSRFGKFIKIEFDERGKINGAHIEWYLLEKSRVIYQTSTERNYHIFYQMLSGLSLQELRKLELPSKSVEDYRYLSHSNSSIPGVDDTKNFRELLSAFSIMGFTDNDIAMIFKVISIVLHIGNVEFVSERAEQASIKNDISTLCKLLGVSEEDFKVAILKPKSKAGREWVSQSKNAVQARFVLNSLSRTLYEKLFAHIVEKINRSLDHGSMTANYIGLLDIAGFEIFKHNSFEQLCINYTNEKLQQFFNHHMFVLEQSEYLKENIHWDYIDYGKDLQSTINLIEQKAPLTGFLPLLDEESILPKSTDESFFSKLISTWDQKSSKFKRSKQPACFILTHYAGDVEYNIDGWLSKNKDPLHDNLLRVLSSSSNELIHTFFDESDKIRGGSFRTASSRHREQLVSLLDQLSSTNPHFARCIIPNNKKKSKDFDRKLILDQLRCNGVLEGIRIAREGYPNRIFFKEFFQRYKILSEDFAVSPNSKKNCEFLLSTLHLDPSFFKVGSTKLFFKAGVLADLELKKEEKLLAIMIRLSANIRGGQLRNDINRQLKKLRAARVLGEAFRTYNKLMEDPWYNLYVKIKPLLTSSQEILKTKKIAEKIKDLELKVKDVEAERDAINGEKFSREKDLKEVRSLLAAESKKLNDRINSLEEAKAKHELLKRELDQSAALRRQIEEEKRKMQQQHEQALVEASKIKEISNKEEEKLKELEENNSRLTSQLKDFKLAIAEKECSMDSLLAAKNEFSEELEKSKLAERSKQDKIDALKQKLNTSEQELNIKLVTIEKNCNAAMNRLQALISENADLHNQINSSEKERMNINREIKSKEREMHRMKEKIDLHQSEITSISTQRDNTIAEHAKVVNELKETRAQLSDYKMKCQSLEKDYESLQLQTTEKQKAMREEHLDNTKLNDLERRLAEEVSLNSYLNQRISSRFNDNRNSRSLEDIFGASDANQEEIFQSYQNLNIEFNEMKRKLAVEIEEKKNLISRLRFTETRLASSSFDSQIAHSQVKILKEIINKSNLSVNLDKALAGFKPSDVNIEKLVLEVDHLRRQLQIETKAHCDAENVAAALHNKFNQIQRSDSSSDIYRLKYEASEERAKSLETKLRSLPLKDKTNLPGDIFTNRESISKYADEVRYHKLENYKLQEILGDSRRKVAALNHEIKQFNTKEVMLTEQIERLQKDLQSTERQNELMMATIKQQKQQYESCLSDLHVNESQAREYMHNLRQAEEDVQSMAEIIEKLKLQSKQKDKLIWQRETERNDSEMQLQETILELKRVQEINKMLNSDLGHLKERLSNVEDKSKYLEEIDRLKSEINSYMKIETGLKKEISTSKYHLEASRNDFEAKISELLKQTSHYENLVDALSGERDMADAAEKDLAKKLEALTLRANSLAGTVDSLLREKTQMQTELERLKHELENSSNTVEKSLQDRHDISNNVRYLEETLKLQRDQNSRNEALVKQLHDDMEELKVNLKSEKEKNIELYEENQSILKSNSQFTSKISALQAQLADSTEQDAWLAKIHELENMVSQESELKYDEMKTTKNLERIIDELKHKNSSQAEVINAANADKEQFQKDVMNYNNQINLMEKHISKQEIDLKKCVRDNSYFQSKIEELEREATFWKKRYESMGSGNANARTSRKEEVFI